VPPSSYVQWTAEEKVAWWREHLDVGRGGSSAEGEWWREAPDSCTHEECIYPGGLNTHKDVVAPYECRQRGVHPTGLAAWVKAVWYPNPYTGLFQKSEYGFARWGFQQQTWQMYRSLESSKAHEDGQPLTPVTDQTHWNTTDCTKYDCANVTKGYTYDERALEPGERPESPNYMALKFFRDGVPSANIHTASVSRSTWNHFSRSYSNLVPNFGDKPNDTDIAKMSAQGAQRGTQWPGFTGLHDMAMFDQAGNLQFQINFPYQLVFFPSSPAGVVPESVHGGYKRTVELADGWGPGTRLFDIYIKHSFMDPMLPIGRIELASKIMMSADTDRQVFFYHPRYDRDLVLRPELLSQGCPDWWSCPTCPITYEVCNPTRPFIEKFKKARNDSSRGLGVLMNDSLGLTNESLHGLSRWSCTGRPALEASPGGKIGYAEAQQPPSNATVSGSLLQKRTSLRKARTGLRSQWRQLQVGEDMRGDDISVEPRSKLKHSKDWFCQQDPNAWPNAKRSRPWTSSCEAVEVPFRLHSEPEWALPAGCADVPQCSNPEGAWYSSTYPCRCGTSTCSSGQLCTAARSACVAWGPYARR